jgi:glycosyltransferase involved in cell wall biosynthesis
MAVKKYFIGNGKDAFDVVESPDWSADGAELTREILGSTPHVVACHTPSWFLYRLFSEAEYGFLDKVGTFFRPWRWPTVRYCDEIKLVREASAIHSPSRAMLKIVEDCAGPFPLAEIIPNPCPVSSQMGKKLPSEVNRSPLLLFVGKLNVHKGVDYLASIIPLIFDAIPTARFRLIGADAGAPAKFGGGGMKQFLERALVRYADRIEFEKHVPREKVKEEYARADVCLVPSRWENYPMVALESMAEGCPVVGTIHGGVPEMIRAPLYGLVADPGNSKAFSNEVIRVLTDQGLRNNIILNARKMIETELSPECIAEIKIGAYKRTMIRSNN